MLGEGDGRFLSAFTRLNARSEVDYVDASAAMLALARSRLARTAATATKTRFFQLDVRHQALPGTTYDLIVTHFFLDCLNDLEVIDVVDKVANSAAPNTRWVVSDFAQPDGGVSKYIGMWLVQVLYLFFRRTARLEAQKLPSYRPALCSAGFVLEKKERFAGGILFSEIWIRKGSTPRLGQSLSAPSKRRI